MIYPGKLATAPALSLAGAISVALTELTGVSTLLGISAFWTDMVLGLVFLTSAGYWITLTIKASKPVLAIGFVSERMSGRLYKKIVPNAVVASVLLCIACWFIYVPLAQPWTPAWKLCGAITGGCSPAFCIIPLDSKLRPISSECTSPLDSSGYFEVVRQSATDYPPVWMKIQCSEKEYFVKSTPKKFMEQDCNGRMTLK